MRWPLILAPLLTLLAGACSPAVILNALAPHDGVTLTDGIAYGDNARQRLDVYAPTPAEAPPTRPVVVFFYGGSWKYGDRGPYRFVGATLAANGSVVVVPDYRVYPEVTFPGFMTDAAKAVAWARAHAAEFGGDPQRLILIGHSAGAHIAALLALDPSYLRAEGVEPSAIAGVVGLAGPYDFLPLRDPVLKVIFGPEADRGRSQPINFVRPDAPPMLLLTGDDDDTVEPRNSRSLAQRLQDVGVDAQLRVYPGIGHGLILGALATPLTGLAPVRRDILSFIAAIKAGRG